MTFFCHKKLFLDCETQPEHSVSGGLVCYASHHRRAVIGDGKRAVWETFDPGVSPAS